MRPSLLVLGSAALALAAVVILWPRGDADGGPAAPRPVPPGDQEIVWLNAATSGVAWERFVPAIRQVQSATPDLSLDDAGAVPEQTAAVPEVALTRRGGKARLWVRWYKLTGQTKIPDWVEALARRDPPPLAIIGGGSSDRARDL